MASHAYFKAQDRLVSLDYCNKQYNVMRKSHVLHIGLSLRECNIQLKLLLSGEGNKDTSALEGPMTCHQVCNG